MCRWLCLPRGKLRKWDSLISSKVGLTGDSRLRCLDWKRLNKGPACHLAFVTWHLGKCGLSWRENYGKKMDGLYTNPTKIKPNTHWLSPGGRRPRPHFLVMYVLHAFITHFGLMWGFFKGFTTLHSNPGFGILINFFRLIFQCFSHPVCWDPYLEKWGQTGKLHICYVKSHASEQNEKSNSVILNNRYKKCKFLSTNYVLKLILEQNPWKRVNFAHLTGEPLVPYLWDISWSRKKGLN